MKIAVAGLGFMGATHVAAIANIPTLQLIAVVSADPVKRSGDLSATQGNLGREARAFDFAGVRQYARLEEALADPEVEAVDLCVPTWLHEPTALAALAAGKHVLVEKPMALEGDACGRMISGARSAGRILMTAQVLRFWPEYQPLREVLRREKAAALEFRRECAAPQWGGWLSDPARSGGAILDLLIHDVDLCVHLLGLPVAVSATGAENPEAGVDIVEAQLRYAGGLTVTIAGGWRPGAFRMAYRAEFAGGALEFDSASGQVTRRGGAEQSAVPVPAGDAFEAELRYFADCASMGSWPTLCAPEESANAVRVARLIAQARAHAGKELPCQF